MLEKDKKSKLRVTKMEDTGCPGDTSPTPNNSIHCATQAIHSDGEAELYTFSQEITYNSADSAEDDVTDEVDSYALNPPPLKHAKTSSSAVNYSPDLISTFPDSILLHILSFLPAEYAVATGVLSKRWRHLWTAVPTLFFRLWSWRHGLDQFVEFVSQTLFLYSCADIRKFQLDFDCAIHFQFRVYGWLHFATRHKVEELKLDFYRLYADERYPMVYFYKLPQFLYSYGLLKKLSLSFCDIIPDGSINWKLLQTLSISYAKLSDDLVERVLLGTPVLESLELYKCAGITRLNASSANLRKLVINEYWGCRRAMLEISGPNLQSLRILGFLYRKHCLVENLSSLVDVTLNFQLLSEGEVDLDGFCFEEYQNMLREILEKLHHVRKLTIGAWCIQVLSICEMRGLPSPLSNCHHLILNTCLNSWDFPGIASLLHCSPDLEMLVINIIPPCSMKFEFDSKSARKYDSYVAKYLDSKNMYFDNSLRSLKTVKVAGFKAEGGRSDFVIALVEFLLKNARVLERMVFCAFRQEDFPVVGQRLLNLPRSSSCAEIILRS